MLTFEEAKKLIISGGDVTLLNELDFDVNKVHESKDDFNFHDSSNFENTFYTNVSQIILHVAIIANNLEAIKILIARGARIDIPRNQVDVREQKYLISGDSYTGLGEWSEPEKTQSNEKIETCIELAKGNQSILDLLSLTSFHAPSSSAPSTSGNVGLEEVTLVSPEEPLQITLKEAKARVDEGDFKKAKILYKKALQLNSESSEALSFFGDLYRMQGDLAQGQEHSFDLYIKAKIYLEAAMVRKESSPYGFLFLARLLFPTFIRITQNIIYQGKAKDLLLAYYEKHVHGQESKNSEDFRMWARVCIDLSNIFESTPILDYVETLKWRALALKYISEALALDAEDVLTQVEHAYIYFVIRDYSRAADIIQKVLVTHPHLPEAQIVNEKIQRARGSISLMETHESLARLRAPGFYLRGKYMELRVPDSVSDAMKATIFSHKETIEHIPSFYREEGWDANSIRCYSQRYLEYPAPAVSFDMIDVSTQQVCGVVYVHGLLSLEKADFGIIIHKNYWRRGFATEVHLLLFNYLFSEVGLRSIESGTATTNLAMRRFYETLGLTGAQSDVEHRYTITISDWPRVKANFEKKLSMRHDTASVGPSSIFSSSSEQSEFNEYHGKVVKHVALPSPGTPQRKITMYGFPNFEAAQKQELIWQQQVQEKFFRVGYPLREGTLSYKYHALLKEHLESGAAGPLPIDTINRRSFIIALSKLISEQSRMPELHFKLGETHIVFESSPQYQKRQIGNFKMVVLNCYDIKYGEGCITRLSHLISPSRWEDSTHGKKRKETLMKLISQKLLNNQAFSIKEISQYNKIKIWNDPDGNSYDKKNMESVHFLNGLLCLITMVEVLVRLYRTKEGKIHPYSVSEARESDAFPVAVAQARSLLLLLSGKISFSDFLGETMGPVHRGKFGCVTGIDTISNISIMLEKLLNVNQKYNEDVMSREYWKPFRQQYLSSNPQGILIEGRSGIYRDLFGIYGDGKESDSDEGLGYSDDELQIGTESVLAFKP